MQEVNSRSALSKKFIAIGVIILWQCNHASRFMNASRSLLLVIALWPPTFSFVSCAPQSPLADRKVNASDSARNGTVTCKASLGRENTLVRLEGACEALDGTILDIAFCWCFESWTGRNLWKRRFPDPWRDSHQVEVKNASFAAEFPVFGPGEFEVVVSLKFSQPLGLRQDGSMSKKPHTEWKFSFLLWDDGFIGSLSAEKASVLSRSREARALRDKWENAQSSGEAWTEEKYALYTEGRKLEDALRSNIRKTPFTALAWQTAMGFQIRTFPSKPNYNWGLSGFEASTDSVDDASDELLCGKESCLWLLKDLRRTGVRSPQWLSLLAELRDKPGVKEHAVALSTAVPSMFDSVENEIRNSPSLRVR